MKEILRVGLNESRGYSAGKGLDLKVVDVSQLCHILYNTFLFYLQPSTTYVPWCLFLFQL